VFEIRSYAETGSTNDDAIALLGRTEGLGIALVADYQRAGKGRRARNWIAPPGSSLLLTVVLPNPVPSSSLWAVPFWTALAVAEGIERETSLRVDLQWPNDLLLEARKCCGILCVSRVIGDHAWVACGSGINVLRPRADQILATVEPPPAFLSDRTPDISRRSLLEAILRAYDSMLDELNRPEDIARAWERRAGLDGTPYRLLVDGSDAPFEAIARRLSDDGSLIVDDGSSERRISLADARVLRT